MQDLLVMESLKTAQIGPWSLRLQFGEILQVTGASGSGKSLLLRALADLDPNSGRVALEDQERGSIAPTEWRRRVAYVPAETAWWHARVDAHFPAGGNREQARLWAERLGLPEEALDWECERLSSGEKQRLGLLRVLLNGPRVLLLDEPTANLDLENSRRVERAVRGYVAEQQAGVIWVSHDSLQRGRLGGRILEIRDGDLIA